MVFVLIFELLPLPINDPTNDYCYNYLHSGKSGRPTVDYEQSSKRSKRRKASELQKSTPSSALSLATEMSLRAEGRKVEAVLVKEALNTTPSRASKISKVWNESQKETVIHPYTPNEALALILDTGVSRHGYQLMRVQAKERGVDLYPSYKKIQQAKSSTYPSGVSVTITEKKAEVQLQALLDLTANRIAVVQQEVFSHVSLDDLTQCVLISKWGFDGSGNQKSYKQSQDNEFNDSSILLTTLVPLQLYIQLDDSSKRTILWQNPRPSSTRFCRPIKIEFTKETTNSILQEKQYVQDQINKMSPSLVETDHGVLNINHQLALSMIDGKVCNALTNTKSAQMCYVCGALPKDMNNLDKVMKRQVDESTLELGLSTLHAYIRFLEWLLHVSYRLETKSYHKTKALKAQIESREVEIKRRFQQESGLLVDMVKEGHGTTNDGNTARRFFANAAQTSAITGINKDLIDRCDTILRAMSSGYSVNIPAFRCFAEETAHLYVSLYEWYPMPASVHKILIHGSQAIQVALVPIGMLSEEAQESRNKDFRKFRERYARKTSRKDTMEDVFHNMLLSSDPLLSTIRSTSMKPNGNLKPAVLSLLEPPQLPLQSDDEDEF